MLELQYNSMDFDMAGGCTKSKLIPTFCFSAWDLLL
jgi:hypothetical protein